MSDQPPVPRAEFPPDDGERGGDDDQPLTWREVDPRMRDAPNYWLAADRDARRAPAHPSRRRCLI